MVRKLRFAFLAMGALALASAIGSSSEVMAQSAQDRSVGTTDFSAQAQQKKGSPRRSAAPSGPRRSVSQPRTQRSVSQPRTQRSVSQPRTQRSVSQPRIQRSVGQPRTQRSVSQPRTQRSVSQAGSGQRVMAIRGASRTTIGGRNYSIWRDSRRVRRGANFRTFVGLSTLGALMFGSAYYYPYAYIDAPAPYCEGLTEDGCQLQWRLVPTLEGPMEYQCVAYCPWQ